MDRFCHWYWSIYFHHSLSLYAITIETIDILGSQQKNGGDPSSMRNARNFTAGGWIRKLLRISNLESTIFLTSLESWLRFIWVIPEYPKELLNVRFFTRDLESLENIEVSSYNFIEWYSVSSVNNVKPNFINC